MEFVEPARLEGANGAKDLQGQAVERLEVGWESGAAHGRSAGETEEPLLGTLAEMISAKKHKRTLVG